MNPPRPTEYKGVVFRSKSEAVVARGLDILGAHWQYEPTYFNTTEWRPDFEVMAWGFDKTKRRSLLRMVIEYKPALVTPTYVSTLRLRMLKVPVPAAKCLIMGSPFDPSSQRLCLELNEQGRFETNTRIDQWFFPFWKEALTYRFDLA